MNKTFRDLERAKKFARSLPACAGGVSIFERGARAAGDYRAVVVWMQDVEG